MASQAQFYERPGVGALGLFHFGDPPLKCRDLSHSGSFFVICRGDAVHLDSYTCPGDGHLQSFEYIEKHQGRRVTFCLLTRGDQTLRISPSVHLNVTVRRRL